MHTAIRRGTAGLCAAALAAGVAVTAGGAAMAAPRDEPNAKRYCAYLLDKIRPGETFSRIRGQSCAPTMRAAKAGAGVSAASTLLMQLAENANMGGTVKSWSGSQGPCDTAGYGIRNLDDLDFNDTISSFTTNNSRCNYVNMWTDAAYQGKHAYWYGWTRVDYVGDAVNDQVSSIHVHYEP